MVRYMAFGVLLKKKKKKKKSKQTNNYKFEISAVFWTKKHLYIEGLSLETSALETLQMLASSLFQLSWSIQIMRETSKSHMMIQI